MVEDTGSIHCKFTKSPPSTSKEAPVTYFARSLAKNTAGPARSSGSRIENDVNEEYEKDVSLMGYLRPSLPRQVRLIMPSRFASSERSSLLMSVAIVPGRRALARMLYFPRATAQLCMRDRIAAFVGV